MTYIDGGEGDAIVFQNRNCTEPGHTRNRREAEPWKRNRSGTGSDTVLFDQTQVTCMFGSNGRPDFNTPKMICTSLRIAAPMIAILGLPA
jgi:hypothetical protein